MKSPLKNPSQGSLTFRANCFQDLHRAVLGISFLCSFGLHLLFLGSSAVTTLEIPHFSPRVNPQTPFLQGCYALRTRYCTDGPVQECGPGCRFSPSTLTVASALSPSYCLADEIPLQVTSSFSSEDSGSFFLVLWTNTAGICCGSFFICYF